MKSFVLLIIVLTLVTQLAAAQKTPVTKPVPPPPPPPKAKATPADFSEKSEEQLAAELAETIKFPVEWKLRTFDGFEIKTEMPRLSVRQKETFYERGIGRMEAQLEMSLSDDAVYTVARLSLPYSVTDEKILRALYNELLKGLSESSEAEYQHIRDFIFDGKLGVEMRSLPHDVRFQPNRARSFTFGRDIYLLSGMPSEDESEDEPPEKDVVDARMKDFDRFFGSVAIIPRIEPPKKSEPQQFSSVWKDGIFSSNYFRFSFKPPKEWIRVTEDDVEAVKDWGRKVISEESGGKRLPRSDQRRNIATFISAPLGNDGVAMISFNLGIPSNSFEDVKKLAVETERLVSRLSTYKIEKQPAEAKISSSRAIFMVNRITIAEVEQKQFIYYFLRTGYVLGVTITCVDDADCVIANKSLDSFQFDEK